MSNLTQRIITAVVLLALFIPALIAGNLPFALLTLLLIGAAAWEWSRLIGWTGWRAWASGAFCVLFPFLLPLFGIMTTAWAFNERYRSVELAALALAGLFWLIGGPWLLWRGVARWPALARWLRWCIGMATLSVAWIGLVGARDAGVNFLLSVLALVWAADIGAYAFGRALGGKLTGGRKLAPSISPGKTWEGAIGGFICVLLLGAIWVWFEPRPSSPSFYTTLWQYGPVWFFGGLALFTAMSVAGDLTESLVKRAAGFKDSSQLLPGHGGVLDRIDALLPVLPLAMLIMKFPLMPEGLWKVQ